MASDKSDKSPHGGMLRKHVLAEQLNELNELKMGPPLIPPRGDDAMRGGDPLPLRGLFHYSFPLALPQGRGVLPLSGGRVHAGCCALRANGKLKIED